MASDSDPLVATTSGKAAPATAPVKGVPGTGPGQATYLALARNPKPAAFANGAAAFPQAASAYGT